MVEINLLPWREQLKSKQHHKKILEVVFVLLLSMLLLAGLHLILDCQLKTVRPRLAKMESGLVKVNQGLEAVRVLYQELDYQKLPELDLSLIFNHQRQVLGFLRRLAERMPQGMYLRQIHFDEQAWVIEGVSQVLADILLFTEQLKNNATEQEWHVAFKKEKYLKIMHKSSVFYYQLRLEAGI